MSLPIRTRLSIAACLLGLAAPGALAQGPWGPATTPFTTVPAGLTTSFRQLQTIEPATLWGWSFTNGVHGTSESQLSVSTTSGQAWQQVRVAEKTRLDISTYTGTEILDAWMTDAQHAWLLSRDVATGTVSLKISSTGLQGFSSQPAPASAAKIRFFSATTGIIVGQPTAGTWPLYRSTNGGTSWAPVSNSLSALPADTPYELTQVGSSAWMTTTKGQLLRTTDAGQTWSLVTLPTGGVAAHVAFRDATHGLLLTPTQVLRTADAGQTWQAVGTTDPARPEGLVAIPGSNGTYISFSGACVCCLTPACNLGKGSAVSTDDGATWRQLENSVYHTFMAARSSGHVWTSTYANGQLLQTANVLSTARPRAVAAALAWPNPSTGKLELAPAAQARRFTLMDATGRRRAYTVPAQATTLDLSGCAAGLYVLQCLSGGELQTQRLVLLQP